MRMLVRGSAWVRQAASVGSSTAFLARPLQFRFNSNTSGSSIEAPSYSSSGSLTKMVTTLGLPRISTVILTGQPNRPFPPEVKLDLDSMFEGGKQAVGVVTEALAKGEDLSSLEGLVSEECLDGLRRSLSRLASDPEKRTLLHIPPEDVFLAFIPDLRSLDGAQSLLIVTFSLPGLGRIKEQLQQQRQVAQQLNEEFKKTVMDLKEGHLDKKQFNEVLKTELDEAQERMKEVDPFATFQQTEIVIGNFWFQRPNPETDWTIVEMSQVNSVEVWAWPFRKRWKGRLGISLRGYPFNKVLRVDYFTDWVALIFIVNTLMVNMALGGMASGGDIGMPPQ